MSAYEGMELANPRRHRPKIQRPSRLPDLRQRCTAWRPPAAASSAPSASGTTRKSPSTATTSPSISTATKSSMPTSPKLARNRSTAKSTPAPTAPKATSASAATKTPSPSATSASNASLRRPSQSARLVSHALPRRLRFSSTNTLCPKKNNNHRPTTSPHPPNRRPTPAPRTRRRPHAGRTQNRLQRVQEALEAHPPRLRIAHRQEPPQLRQSQQHRRHRRPPRVPQGDLGRTRQTGPPKTRRLRPLLHAVKSVAAALSIRQPPASPGVSSFCPTTVPAKQTISQWWPIIIIEHPFTICYPAPPYDRPNGGVGTQ